MTKSHVKRTVVPDVHVAADAILVATCDAYWNLIHRRYYVRLDGDQQRAVAASVTKSIRRSLPRANLPDVVERLQRQGLVHAAVHIQVSEHRLSTEVVSRLQPTQAGLDRARELGAFAKAKR